MKSSVWIVLAIIAALIAGILAYDMIKSSENPNPPVINTTNNTNNDTNQTTFPAKEIKTVQILEFSFIPNTLTVKKGTTVEWVNKDSVSHTIESTDGTFKSSLLSKDAKFLFTFNNAGTYTYHCGPHPAMKGKIIVTD